MRRDVTTLELAEMIRLYDDNISIKEIGRRIGRSRSTVARHLIRSGRHTPKPRTVNAAELVYLYRLGMKISELTAYFGISSPTVYYHLHRSGITADELRRPDVSKGELWQSSPAT